MGQRKANGPRLARHHRRGSQPRHRERERERNKPVWPWPMLTVAPTVYWPPLARPSWIGREGSGARKGKGLVGRGLPKVHGRCVRTLVWCAGTRALPTALHCSPSVSTPRRTAEGEISRGEIRRVTVPTHRVPGRLTTAADLFHAVADVSHTPPSSAQEFRCTVEKKGSKTGGRGG